MARLPDDPSSPSATDFDRDATAAGDPDGTTGPDRDATADYDPDATDGFVHSPGVAAANTEEAPGPTDGPPALFRSIVARTNRNRANGSDRPTGSSHR